MIINAYKLDTNKKDLKNYNKEPKIDSQIVKEIFEEIIKRKSDIIEKKDLKKVEEKIMSELYNTYHLTNEVYINNLKIEILNKIFGYGILQKYIDNKNISDIRVVSFKDIYIKEKGMWVKANESFESKSELEEFVRFCALKNNSNLNFETPIVVFSDRKNALRLEAGIEPANVLGPSLVIRIHRKDAKNTIDDLYQNYNMMDKKCYDIVKNKIHPLSNIILCGKGGSGKTTLLKALIERIPKEVSITTNEETAELYLKDRNVIQRECILNRKEDKNIDLDALSRHSLVMSNDVIIIGELKGKEANSFFDSISTGHTGLATIHADSSKNTVDRIITLIKKDIRAQYYTESFLRRFLASSIDYIVFMKDFKVNEITKISYDEKYNKLKFYKIYKAEEKINV